MILSGPPPPCKVGPIEPNGEFLRFTQPVIIGSLHVPVAAVRSLGLLFVLFCASVVAAASGVLPLRVHYKKILITAAACAFAVLVVYVVAGPVVLSPVEAAGSIYEVFYAANSGYYCLLWVLAFFVCMNILLHRPRMRPDAGSRVLNTVLVVAACAVAMVLPGVESFVLYTLDMPSAGLTEALWHAFRFAELLSWWFLAVSCVRRFGKRPHPLWLAEPMEEGH